MILAAEAVDTADTSSTPQVVVTAVADVTVIVGTFVPVVATDRAATNPFASPPGIACFTAKNEYAHGGISPQECIVPELVVERGGASTAATIASVTWRGMRCRVSVTTNDPSVRVDLRLNWKQAVTSIAQVKGKERLDVYVKYGKFPAEVSRQYGF